MGFEEKADKFGMGKHGVERCRGVLWLISNEELDVLEPIGVLGGVNDAYAVFAWADEEEKGDPGEIADGDVSCGGSLCGSVQGLDNADRERPHSCWRIILRLIGRQLASQEKVELPHLVVSGFVGPHRCEDLKD